MVWVINMPVHRDLFTLTVAVANKVGITNACQDVVHTVDIHAFNT
jgi:hypothetical protein